MAAAPLFRARRLLRVLSAPVVPSAEPAAQSAAGVRTPRRSSRPTPQRYEEEFELAQYPTPPPACTTAIGDDDDDALWSPEDDFPAAVAPTQQHEEEEEEEEEKQAAALRRRFTLQQDRLVASRSQSPAPSTISRAMSLGSEISESDTAGWTLRVLGIHTQSASASSPARLRPAAAGCKESKRTKSETVWRQFWD